MSIYTKIYDLILPYINSKDFIIPNKQKDDSYFPDYLKNLLNDYIEFYENNLSVIIDSIVPFSDEKGVKKEKITLNKIKALCAVLIDTVDLYYQGKPYKASENFTTNLNANLINELTFSSSITKNNVFYRARINNG